MIFLTKSTCLKNKFLDFKLLKQNMHLLFLFALFILGLIAGTFSISICKDNNFYDLKDYVSSYILFLKTSDYFSVLLKYFICFTLLVFLNYMLGLCILGNLLLFPISFLYSFGFGSIVAYFYKVYSLNGIAFVLICILPGIFLFSVNYILSLKHSVVFSTRLYSFTLKCKSEYDLNFKNYTSKYVIHIILCLFCATVFSFFSSCFVEKFNL